MPGRDWYAEEVGAQRLDVALAEGWARRWPLDGGRSEDAGLEELMEFWAKRSSRSRTRLSRAAMRRWYCCRRTSKALGGGRDLVPELQGDRWLWRHAAELAC